MDEGCLFGLSPAGMACERVSYAVLGVVVVFVTWMPTLRRSVLFLR